MKPIRLSIHHIDRQAKIVHVKTSTGNIFPCRMNDLCVDGMRYGDDAVVIKSAVTGEWLCIDYKVCTPTNYAIHNSYQTNHDDLILDEEGVPYE